MVSFFRLWNVSQKSLGENDVNDTDIYIHVLHICIIHTYIYVHIYR